MVLVHLRHLLFLAIPRGTFLEYKSGGCPPPPTCVRPRPTPSQPGPQDAQGGEALEDPRPSRDLFRADYRTDTQRYGKLLKMEKVQELNKITSTRPNPKGQRCLQSGLATFHRFLPVGVFYMNCVCAQSLSRVPLFVTSWTVWLARVFDPWNSPGQSTGVGCKFLLQGIFSTQGSNSCLLLADGLFATVPRGKPLHKSEPTE